MVLKAYSFDHATGFYTGPYALSAGDVDPKQPGRLTLPGNCVTQEPPQCGRGLWPRWNASLCEWEAVEVEVRQPERELEEIWPI